MYHAIFIYRGQNIIIQCNLDEKMKEIIQKFKIKAELNKEFIYYLYQGNQINQELKLENIISLDDKNLKQLKIVVNVMDESKQDNYIIKSKNIICPECKENIRIKIEDYLIKLYDCKNGHIINNISLEKYETQNIDISKIICENCKENNKSNTYNNEMYRCLNCKINICPWCKSYHNKKQNIINYDKKDYICEIHIESYMKYCNNCKKNICLSCSNEHKSHDIISYENIISDIDEIENKKKELKGEIDVLNDDIKKIINILNKVMNNIEKFIIYIII